MGRGRGKGKKHTVINAHDDHGSGEEEKFLASKRRGRPQKPMKDDAEVEETEKNEGDTENDKSTITSKSIRTYSTSDDGAKKRKQSLQAKENSDPVKEENGSGPKSGTDDSVNFVGFRKIGSRRKSKPRRAAEAGVECK